MPELAGKVADAFEIRVREHEDRWLSPLAVRSSATATASSIRRRSAACG
jgi:hypothetical protein